MGSSLISGAAPHDPKRVLVFPCGSEIGLELHHALQYSRHVTLTGASSAVSNHGRYVYRDYIDGLPFVHDAAFLPELEALVAQRQIDFLYPAHDSVVLELARHAERFPCQIVGSPPETCEICRRKSATYSTFAGLLRTPRILDPEGHLDFPVFLKPDVGEGSRGTAIARTSGEVRYLTGRMPGLLVLEHLPGREYTVDCFTDRHGTLRFAGPRERVRVQGGISTDTVPADDEAFTDLAERINATLRFQGAWFFQVKEASDGELALLEIAPRLAGSMGMYRNLGVNFALLSIFDRMGREVTILRNRHRIRMDRALESRFDTDLAYGHVYVDLDDTILVNQSVNLLAACFLFQCRNRGVRIHLLSRHSAEIHETLARFGLTALFDTITHVRDGSPKSRAVGERDAIFIDDSFAERLEVHHNAGIPTFGLDSLESLMDWRI